MIVPRHQPPDFLKPHRPLPNHTLTKRPRLSPEQILIRSLALDDRIPALGHQLRPTTFYLALGDQHVDSAFVQVHSEYVAVFEDR
jgi:hypothetical protein